MAKENTVYLYGQVSAIQIIKENDRSIRGMVIIKTISNHNFSTPLILSENEEIIERMSWLKQGDMVRIKGVVSVKNVYKTQICPKCGRKNRVKGVRFCIIPISLHCEERNLNEETGLKQLQEEGKFVNRVWIAGTVCNRDGAMFYQNNSGSVKSASYQIASNRKFFVKEDDMDIKTDYPWIHTIGNQAISDASNLKQGSQILVRGSITSREIERTSTCQYCKTSYVWWDQAGEISAYDVCYLDNDEVNENISGLDQATVLGKIEYIRISNDGKCSDVSLSVMPHVNFFNSYTAETYSIMLLARRKKEIEKIQDLKVGDYILACGTISQATKKKKIICPSCKKEYIDLGISLFIYPSFIKKIRDPLHESLNINMLSEYKELSNNISFVGIVSSKPLFSSEKQTCVYYATFKHSLKTEKGEISKKETIRICSTGKQAREDMLRLLPGTKVFINGFLRSYDEEKTYRCECNNSYHWNQSVTEIVPYSVEYLSGYLDDTMIKSIL